MHVKIPFRLPNCLVLTDRLIDNSQANVQLQWIYKPISASVIHCYVHKVMPQVDNNVCILITIIKHERCLWYTEIEGEDEDHLLRFDMLYK